MIAEKSNRDIPSSKKIRSSLILLAVLLGAVFVFIKFYPLPPLEKTQPVKTQEAPPLPRERVIAGKIVKRDTLSSALRSQNISAELVEFICRQLKPLVNLRRVKPGEIGRASCRERV